MRLNFNDDQAYELVKIQDRTKNMIEALNSKLSVLLTGTDQESYGSSVKQINNLI